MGEPKWYKGNIHTHTNESDGDSDPEFVTQWYREHDYDFLVLSDHNHLTLLEYGSSNENVTRPIMIPGEEVTTSILGGTVPVHINGIGISRVVEPIDAGDILSTLQANVDAIREAGGIASINHPNFFWAFDHNIIKQVENASLLEIFNGHPLSNNLGGAGKPSVADIWDKVLTSGKTIFGVASDDSHNYHDFSYEMSNPGRGWVFVRAEELTKEAIVDSLSTGNFYASTGVEFLDLQMSEIGLEIEINQSIDFVYETTFSGLDGKILKQCDGLSPSYCPTGNEGYVRATVLSSSGGMAWTQPVFLD